MDERPRCSCCGAVLRTSAAGDRALRHASRIGSSRESLVRGIARPASMAERLDQAATPPTGPPPPTWWLPSLALLAYASPDVEPEGRAALDELARRRDELAYAVVEELTDTIVGLTLQPWPLVDPAGRLRFPIRSDPLQLDVAAGPFTELVDGERRRWHELGLMDLELVERPIHIGDTFAVVVVPATSATPPSTVATPCLRAHNDDEHSFWFGGLPARRGGPAVPIVDVTWDAREAGKLAHYAASAGVIPPEPTAAVATVLAETETRYLVGYAEGVDPRDVGIDPDTGEVSAR